MTANKTRPIKAGATRYISPLFNEKKQYTPNDKQTVVVM
jgi:hypothetical protein